MNTNYSFSNLNASTAHAIPPKTRTVPKTPLFAKLEKLKVGGAFVVDGAQMSQVAPNIYATAKRAGIKVSLRQLPEGVGVWRVRNQNPQTDVERANEGVPAKVRKSTRGRKAA